MTRKDSRHISEIRALSCTTGELFQASGSARWNQGYTSVLASVHGPSSTSNPDANEAGILDVTFNSNKIEIGPSEADWKLKLQPIIESMLILKHFPRTYTKLNIQVLHDDGCVLSCALNGACVALMDAGIPMKSQWISTTLGLMSEDQPILDPDKEEEKNCKALLCTVFPIHRTSPDSGRQVEVDESLVFSDMNGCISQDQFFRCLEFARKTSEKVALFTVQSFQRSFRNLMEQS